MHTPVRPHAAWQRRRRAALPVHAACWMHCAPPPCGVPGLLLLTQHEQQVGEDGAQQRHGHHVVQPAVERGQRQDHLHHVAKGGVEEAAQELAAAQRQVLGDVAQ